MNNDTNTRPLPAFTLYSVTGDGKDARWTKIGAAWTNRDGKGFSLSVGAIPLQGRMVMRAYESKQDRSLR